MSVSNGRQFLAIPGPTTIPDEVLAAMHRPAVDIYGGGMVELTETLLDDLRKVFRTEGHTYIYACNGHGAWEAAAVNVLSRGQKILVLESGRFAVGWGQMAAQIGVEMEILPCDLRRAVDPDALEARLRADAKGEIKAILVVQVDTATGVVNDIPRIRAAIDRAGHGALFMVDTIASLAAMPFEMDAWKVDVAVGASQKGLMCPPGLGFVAANERAKAVHRTADLRTSYWDWTGREGGENYQRHCGTPPEHLLFGLRKSLDMIFAEGAENVFLRHRLLANAVRSAVDRWSEGQALGFNIADPAQRSDSVTTVRVAEGRDPQQIRTYCEKKANVVLGSGIGALSGKAFRIAHMGHVNAPMVLGTLSVVEMALQALGIPHGKGGIQAAVDSLGGSVAA